jgi:hypothetical protein
MALYVFVNYLEETDFLFDRLMTSYELDFHGSFYIGIISFACSLVAALVVFADNSISKVPKPAPPPYAFDNYCFTGDGDVYEFFDEEHDYLLYKHNYDKFNEWYAGEHNEALDESYDGSHDESMYSDIPFNGMPWEPEPAGVM